MASETFWDFSVRTYRTPGVPEACLSLQNDYGADVNMLLFCAWTAAAFGRFDEELFERASGFSENWADRVVKRLRGARTWMKERGCELKSVPRDQCMELRENIKSVEFAAEKMQQEVLETMLPAGPARQIKPGELVEDVVSNLTRYLEYSRIPWNGDVREKLAAMTRAAFPEVSESEVVKALGS